MINQRTLKSIARTVGIGLHSGTRVELCLRPAAVDTGIVFRRVDLDPVVEFPASAEVVGDTRMASTLERDGVRIATVEHLMSALAGLGIDNCYVDVDAPEIPIMDGSAASFVFLIRSVGIVEQAAVRRFVRVLKVVEVREGEGSLAKWARLEPHFGFKLRFSIDFNHPAINSTTQDVEVDFERDNYVSALARARTFGFVNEVEALRAAGLALGGSYENAIVMDEYRVLNTAPAVPSWPHDDPARHHGLDGRAPRFDPHQWRRGHRHARASRRALGRGLLPRGARHLRQPDMHGEPAAATARDAGGRHGGRGDPGHVSEPA